VAKFWFSFGVKKQKVRQPMLNLAVRADRAYRQPTNMQPGTLCYRYNTGWPNTTTEP